MSYPEGSIYQTMSDAYDASTARQQREDEERDARDGRLGGDTIEETMGNVYDDIQDREARAAAARDPEPEPMKWYEFPEEYEQREEQTRERQRHERAEARKAERRAQRMLEEQQQSYLEEHQQEAERERRRQDRAAARAAEPFEMDFTAIQPTAWSQSPQGRCNAHRHTPASASAQSRWGSRPVLGRTSVCGRSETSARPIGRDAASGSATASPTARAATSHVRSACVPGSPSRNFWHADGNTHSTAVLGIRSVP